MSKREIALIVVLVIAVIGILLVGLMRDGKTPMDGGVTTETPEVTPVELPEDIPAFTSEVPQDAVLTTPKVDIAPEPGETKRQGYYDIRATEDGYLPNVITVGQGNIVTLNFASVDAQYDMFSGSFGFYVTAGKGGTKENRFKAGTVGTVLFECRDYCPSGKKIQGQMIVIP